VHTVSDHIIIPNPSLGANTSDVLPAVNVPCIDLSLLRRSLAQKSCRMFTRRTFAENYRIVRSAARYLLTGVIIKTWAGFARPSFKEGARIVRFLLQQLWSRHRSYRTWLLGDTLWRGHPWRVPFDRIMSSISRIHRELNIDIHVKNGCSGTVGDLLVTRRHHNGNMLRKSNTQISDRHLHRDFAFVVCGSSAFTFYYCGGCEDGSFSWFDPNQIRQSSRSGDRASATNSWPSLTWHQSS